MHEPPPAELLDALRCMTLLAPGADVRGKRLTGGVSSDIWRFDLPTGPICVKRALAKLRVAADWQAPVERNRYEARWMQRANAAVAGAAPTLLGLDEPSGTLAMQFLPPGNHSLWKTQLRDGHANPVFAAQVAATLARIHAATAAQPAIAAEFPTDAIFYDIRLEPYLLATGRAHPDLAPQLNGRTRMRVEHTIQNLRDEAVRNREQILIRGLLFRRRAHELEVSRLGYFGLISAFRSFVSPCA